MQYVRSISGSVSKAWNSVNPATLSGAIDVIVVEQENGDLACSPFHVRFGKFSLLRPSDKKVEFQVNGEKTDFAMKLGDGGEAFFVFETTGFVPEEMQTSPLVSPSASPKQLPTISDPESLQELEYLNIADGGTPGSKDSSMGNSITISSPRRVQSDYGGGGNTPLSVSPPESHLRPSSGDWSTYNLERSASEEILPTSARRYTMSGQRPTRGRSPPPLDHAAAVARALALSQKLSSSNIPTQITDRGDVMLDMNGYKTKDEDSLQAEVIARKILAEEIDGDYDIGALIGADRNGNLWIYSSEEAKEQAYQEGFLCGSMGMNGDSVSDAGYMSDDARSEDSGAECTGKSPKNLSTPPSSPPPPGPREPEKNYVKTLRLTSAQLKSLNLKLGANSVSFSVNKATCTAFMYYWKHDVPIVISDIDGTITKSDALGHVLTMLGRDWTHLGVAKLYTDIAANGYHMLYLTSRSVGQADTTRNYLNGIIQDKFKVPKGPVIMSPDRTMAALKREVYLRKPEVFKMACLRDILNLFGPKHNPFYAGFGNRLTDALSYRSVNIPSTRIFTINSNAEVSLDLLTLTKYKSSYVNMRDLVDHFFPPVSILNTDEEYTDFNYWRDPLPDPDEFTDSEDEDEKKKTVPIVTRSGIVQHVEETEEEEEEEGEEEEGMRESYMTGMSGNYTEGEGQDDGTYFEEDGEEYSDDEEGEDYDDDEEDDEEQLRGQREGSIVEEPEEKTKGTVEEGLEEKLTERPEDGVKDSAENNTEEIATQKPEQEAGKEKLEEQPTPQVFPQPNDQEKQDAHEEGATEEPQQEEENRKVPPGILHSKFKGPWMKDDLDQSIVGQMVEAVEKEITSIAEDLGERIQRAAARNGDANTGSGNAPSGPVYTAEEEKERHVATQMA
ncbi:LNS2-domain-containing protein [Terfezia boudieri ATCC MYA-4762]|uniref:LNS2-domain-containing protein n=1 Tax=Terfezia boudieri ATCC MYA-4762 TaxID=1051890 RepID=A0A3N4LZ89_9PEZI|nr:LNS2-domain-containing protein [Terfezia boudieri ATCC MYA-4762]